MPNKGKVCKESQAGDKKKDDDSLAGCGKLADTRTLNAGIQH
jgi:hypothetical protein